MPHRLARPCKAFGCPNTTSNPNGYCDEHQALAKHYGVGARENSYRRGYNKRWEKFRIRYLQKHPLCMDCKAEHRLEPSTEVHHKKKLRDYPELKYAENNLMALCHQCHSKRTARGE